MKDKDDPPKGTQQMDQTNTMTANFCEIKKKLDIQIKSNN